MPRIDPTTNTSPSLQWLRTAKIDLAIDTGAGGVVAALQCDGWDFASNYIRADGVPDRGRQLQTAGTDGHGERGVNPTQGGDAHGNSSRLLPGTEVLKAGTVSKCKPLLWLPEWNGGSADNPVAWDGEIETRTYISHRRPNRIEYYVSVKHVTPCPRFTTEVVTAYLTNDFTRCYSWVHGHKFPQGRLVEKHITDPADNPQDTSILRLRLRKGTDAAILSTANKRHALGLYIPRGKNYRLAMFDAHQEGGPDGVHDPGTWKINMTARDRNIEPRVYDYLGYIAVGSVDEVAAEFLAMKGDRL